MFNILGVVTKGIEVFEATITAGFMACKRRRSRKDEFIAIVQLAFATLQIADLSIRSSHLYSAKLKVELAYLTALLEIGRFTFPHLFNPNLSQTSISKIAQIGSEALGKLGFRISDVADVSLLLDLSDQSIQFYKDLESYGQFAMAFSALAFSGIRLKDKLSPALYNRIKNCFSPSDENENPSEDQLETIAIEENPIVNNENVSPEYAQEQKETNDSSSSSSHSLPIAHENFRAISTDPLRIHDQISEVINSYRTARQSNQVRSFFNSLSQFPDFLEAAFICPISKRPVLRPITPSSTESNEHTSLLNRVVYDESSFNEWVSLHGNSSTPPPSWPREYWPPNQSQEIFPRDEQLQEVIYQKMEESLEELTIYGSFSDQYSDV